MKNKKAIIHLIEVAYACLILLGPALIFAGEKSGGHVIVNRVANFGTDLSLSVSVDGSEVANLVEGRNYDGYLPPGKHVISAVVSPNREDSHPGNVTINVKVGETYSFTAVWQGEDLALVNNEQDPTSANQELMPAARRGDNAPANSSFRVRSDARKAPIRSRTSAN